MKKLIYLASVALALSAMNVWADAPAADGAEKEAAPAADEPEAKPKKRPKKMPEYKLWSQAEEVSAAWEQPVIVFVGVQGDKGASRMKRLIVGNPAFKELVAPNALYYSNMLPEAKSKGHGKQAKDAPLKPDYSSIRPSEKAFISRIAAPEKKVNLPILALVEPARAKVLCMYTLPEDEITFTSFVNTMKEGFEAGKYSFEINRKVQKVLDDEAKKAAAAEKRKK